MVSLAYRSQAIAIIAALLAASALAETAAAQEHEVGHWIGLYHTWSTAKPNAASATKHPDFVWLPQGQASVPKAPKSPVLGDLPEATPGGAQSRPGNQRSPWVRLERRAPPRTSANGDSLTFRGCPSPASRGPRSKFKMLHAPTLVPKDGH